MRPDSTRTAEKRRVHEGRAGTANWKLWGPYLSERQWGTVREDYSAGGAAWEFVTHDHARSRAYRWGEDGIAGICDDQSRLCLALALWNGRDTILKERLFGLANGEGNHGEDVKECYYYLDATPTHSYLKMLYKYPQREFPYARLAQENRRRGKRDPEFELLDTGIFDDDRYFDVFVEYAKSAPEDVSMKVTVHNRGPDSAEIHLLPQLWFRNTWSWHRDSAAKPLLFDSSEPKSSYRTIAADDPRRKRHQLYCEGEPELLFCENETNARRMFGMADAVGYFKDAFHEYVIGGATGAVNPLRTGTKSAAHYRLVVGGGSSACVRLRLAHEPVAEPFAGFDELFTQRQREADAFYGDMQFELIDPDARRVQRQAFAGMIWSKQFYYYDVPEWLAGDPTQPSPPPERKHGRNSDWKHLNNADIISMPDKWEYPWYAAWDLAFHCIPLALVDAEFAKAQLVLLAREWYMHPNGQLPAYEWALGDVNPP
ncbi:MAG TPA: glucosidase, partial [Pirellulales bacterium]|nr:glucosidase [Pirellulales bacterium]